MHDDLHSICFHLKHPAHVFLTMKELLHFRDMDWICASCSALLNATVTAGIFSKACSRPASEASEKVRQAGKVG